MLVSWFYIPSLSMYPTLRTNDRVIVNMSAYRLRLPLTDITLYEYRKPKRGDVVIFKEDHSGSIFVKRVIGIAGDIVEIDAHHTYVNGELLSNAYVTTSENHTRYTQSIDDKSWLIDYQKWNDKIELFYEAWLSDRVQNIDENDLSMLKSVMAYRRGKWQVPTDHVFVLGDNRDRSKDSRDELVGFVPTSKIRGRVSFVLANAEPLTIGDINIHLIPSKISNFNRSIYAVDDEG